MLPTPQVAALFVFAALALLVTPGPAVLYIVTRSLDQGRRAGLASVAGIGVGTLVHTTAAAIGLSALLASSATAFAAVKFVGGLYLVYLGVRRMLGRGEEGAARVVERRPLARVFAQGVVVNVLNPKTALFFLAFLPQFVDPRRGPVAGQIVVLGALMALLGLVSDGAYALLAGTVREGLLRRAGRVVRAQRYVSGSVFIVLGLGALLARRHA